MIDPKPFIEILHIRAKRWRQVSSRIRDTSALARECEYIARSLSLDEPLLLDSKRQTLKDDSEVRVSGVPYKVPREDIK